MFSLHDFIMKTLNGMIGNYPDFQVKEYALNWYSKGKLTEEDLAQVEEWLLPKEVIVEETQDVEYIPYVEQTQSTDEIEEIPENELEEEIPDIEQFEQSEQMEETQEII